MSDAGQEGQGQDQRTTEEIGGFPTPPPEAIEQLTDDERIAVQENRNIAFHPSANNISIPMLDGAKNWDHWYNTLLGMCEMADIDRILTGGDALPTRKDGESAAKFNKRSIYWKTANKYITGAIRSSLKPGGLAHITGLSNCYHMINKLRSQYKSKGYTSREVLWRTISRTTLESCKSMTEWVETIKKAKSSLMELESTLPQWVITTTFLHGLPSSYDSFVEIILNSRGKDAHGRLLEPDFDEVCDKVMDRERRQKMMSPEKDSKESKALKASTPNNKSNNRQKGRNGQKPRCAECNALHGPTCYLANPEKAPQEWRDNNKDRIAEYQKKKKEKKQEKACCAMDSNVKDPGFFFDSAASLHYTYSMAWFSSSPTLLSDPIEVQTCDGNTVYATHKGVIKLNVLIKNRYGQDDEWGLSIKDVHYCPEMNINLISLGTLVQNGLSFGASKRRLTVRDDDDDIIMEGALINTLFKLRLSDSDDSKAKHVAKALIAKNLPHKKASAKFWHETLGHLNYGDLAKLPSMVEGMQIVGPIKKEFCEPCALAKQQKTPSREEMSAVTGPFHRIHTDLLGGGDTLPRTVQGYKYASTITDQDTRHRWVDFLKKKDDALPALKNFVTYVQVQFQINVRIIRSDNGGEYDSDEVRDWMKSIGIVQELTMPDSPEQNGIDERTNGILLTRARAQLIAAGLPPSLWAEAFRTAIYIINRSPTSALSKTPHEALWERKPNLSRMHPFGSVCYAHDYKCKTKGKMAPRGFKCFFLGYEGTNQYRLWDAHNIKLVRRRDVIWVPFGASPLLSSVPNDDLVDVTDEEDEYVVIPTPLSGLDPSDQVPHEHSPGFVSEISDDEQNSESGIASPGQISPGGATPQEFATGDPNLTQERLRHSTRNQRKDYYSLHHKGFAKAAITTAPLGGFDEPRTYKDAINGPEQHQWLQAMQSEYDSLIDNKTWKLVEPPHNRSVLRGRWVYKKKIGIAGTVVRWKARWVVKGYLQQEGIDYNETYSGVIKP